MRLFPIDTNQLCRRPAGNSVLGLPARLLLLVVFASGCQQGMYNATSLPQELAVRPLVDTSLLDLARLSSNSSSSQRINPGDQLSVTVVTGAEDEAPSAWPVRIADDGTARIPLVGVVHLAGQDLQTAQAVISNASIERGVYHQPTVSLTVDERRSNRITVMGAVEEPGEYELSSPNSDLLTAIGMAGGLTEFADTIVEISQPPVTYRRPQKPSPTKDGKETDEQIAQVGYQSPLASQPELMVGKAERGQVDLVRATASPPPSGFPLRDGSVVIVRKRPSRFVHVMGLVNRPNQFELPSNQNIRVLDAIAMAGGRTYTLADRVFVVRPIPYSTKPALIEVSVKDAKESNSANILLADGDVVSVEETPLTLMLGVLNQFVRFGVNGSIRAF